MSSPDWQVCISIAFVLGIFAVLQFLGLVLCREWVKNDLHDRCLRPLSVRWRPFALWGGWYGSAFVVRYVDLYGLVHKARCSAGGFGHGVRWYSDEIVDAEKEI